MSEASKWKEAYISAIADIAELHAQIARMQTELAEAYAGAGAPAPSPKKRKHNDLSERDPSSSAAAAPPGGFGIRGFM